MTGRSRYAGVRSILEMPVLNDRYWAKLPGTTADAVMLDLEDSAPPPSKAAARDRVVRELASRGAIGTCQVVVRVNNLATPWGHDDLVALAALPGDIVICYPKAETEAEVRQVVDLSRSVSPDRGVYLMVETARAVIDLQHVARCEGLVGLHFGYSDYAADAGCRLYNDAGDGLHDASLYARSKVAAVAAAHGLFATGGSMVPEFRDLAKVERFVRSWVDLGYTACIAVAPSHLPIIDRLLRPSLAALKEAGRIRRAFEDALGRGELNAVLDGRIVTTPDYRNAMLLLSRAG